MKTVRWGACILSLVLLLSACGQSAAPDSVDKGKVSELVDSLANKDTPDTSDVENNGGHYVRVGNRVYFRKYGPDALPTLAMLGDFVSEWGVTGNESEIVYHDLATGEVRTAFRDTGCGGLYVVDGSFYLQERINGENYVVRYSPDGATCETVRKGRPLGLSDGGLLAIEDSDAESNSFYLYRDGEEAGSFSGNSLIYAGVSDSGLFLLGVDYKSETDAGEGTECTLWQLEPDTDGQLLCLGTLPETEYTYGTEAAQFLESGGHIALVVGYYAGTGHFLNDYAVVTATPGVENSLSVLETAGDTETEYGEGTLPELSAGDAGEIVTCSALPGDTRINWETEELQAYDGEQWRTLAAQFSPARLDGSGYNKITQKTEYVGGTVYATLANAYASPLDDIGWRSSYRLLNMTYLAVSEDGGQRELASVDYDTVLQGYAWFLEGAETLLLQQNTFEEGVWKSETDDAFMIPVSPDAEWDGKDALLSGAVYVEPTGAPEYGGWTLPDTEGQFLCLRLNRDGEAVYLTTKSPDALLSIDIGVTEAELSDAVEKIELTRRASDEDTPWYWARLTALEDGVTLLIERTPDETNTTEELAMTNGEFVPGSTLFRRIMKRGESVGLYVSMPWHAEVRASVTRGGAYGAYVFGEDNYLHEDPVDGRFAQKILSGYPPADYDGFPVGTWLYRDPESGEHTAKLDFMEGLLGVGVGDDYYTFSANMEHLHSEEWENPDLLRLTAEDENTVAALNGMSGSVGDYYAEYFKTDGETILHLYQTNNGDAALDMLLPHQSEFLPDIVLHRYSGAAEDVAPLRNITLTAEVAKVESDRNIVWLREAEAYEWDELVTLYCVKPSAACVPCPLASQDLLRAFAECDPEYPVKTFQVTIDREGLVTALDTLS